MQSADYRNILLIRQSALGDVANILPLLPVMRAQYPHARITCLTSSATAALLRSDACVNDVIIFNRTRSPLPMLKMCARLRRQRFDLVIDFQSSRHSRWLTWATGARMRLGHGRRPFLTHALSLDIRKFQACDIFRTMLTPLGIEAVPLQARFPRLQECQALAQTLLHTHDVQAGRYVVFNPGHSPAWLTKRWPVEHWVALGKMLAEQGVKIVVTGAHSDVPNAEQIVNGLGGHALSLAGKTSLEQLAGVMSFAQSVVSTDSGPMHIAAMSGARVVALFGPTSPVTSAPFGVGHKVLHHQLHCSNCFKKRCPYQHECLDAMQPAEVLQAVQQISESNSP